MEASYVSTFKDYCCRPTLPKWQDRCYRALRELFSNYLFILATFLRFFIIFFWNVFYTFVFMYSQMTYSVSLYMGKRVCTTFAHYTSIVGFSKAYYLALFSYRPARVHPGVLPRCGLEWTCHVYPIFARNCS